MVISIAGNRPNWSWSTGFEAGLQYEWFVDCYRMRVNEDTSVAEFLMFSKVAVMMEVILRSEWDWSLYIAKACQIFRGTYKMPNASEKYGAENIFVGVLGIGSGRILRFTAQQIYGSNVFTSLVSDNYPKKLRDEIMARCFGGTNKDEEDYVVDFDTMAELFEDVGGVQIWKSLRNAL